MKSYSILLSSFILLFFPLFFPKKLLPLVIIFTDESITYKSLQGCDSFILCRCLLTRERGRTTIVGWRLVIVFQLHWIRPWVHHIGSLEGLQLHSISLALTFTGCAVWLEKTRLHRCFHKIQRVIGLTNSNTPWDLSLRGVEWTLPMVEKKTSCAFITKVIPSSWCSYLSTGACHDSQHTFPHLIEPCTWHNCNKWTTLHHIDGTLGTPTWRVVLILLHLGTLYN